MQQNLTKNERELIKLAKFFLKRSKSLVEEGKLTEEQSEKIVSSCTDLEASLNTHATFREAVQQKRENLKKVIKDNAACPKCQNTTLLKHTGVATHPEQGWKSNKYRCRKCNTEFVWNRPNNPWDMIPFIEGLITELNTKLTQEDLPEEEKEIHRQSLAQAHNNLEQLKSVIVSTDEEYREMEQRDKEMAKSVHEFKNYLAIEKIRLNTWEEDEGEAK